MAMLSLLGTRARARHTGQLMPVTPEARAALRNLFLAVSKFYAERPSIPMDPPVVRLLATMCSVARDDDADWQMALRRSVDIIGALTVLSADPDISEALRQARRSFVSLKGTQRLSSVQAG